MINKTSYTDLAGVYDALTDDVEYGVRCDYVENLIQKHLGKKPDLLCDLGCGTGTVCSILSGRGYDCIGIDNSCEMLNAAYLKNADGRILFLNQDITQFELFGTVDVFLCMLDTVNYICEEDSLDNMFHLVSNYLNPGGIFIFDVNTEFKFLNVLGNNTMVYEKDDIFYTWDNFYKDGFLDFTLNFFVRSSDNAYQRFCEEHSQRYYSTEYLINSASRVGLKAEAVYGDLTYEAPCEEEDRVFIVLKK